MIYVNKGFAKLLNESSDLSELFSQIEIYWDSITAKAYKLVSESKGGKYPEYNSVICDCIHDGNGYEGYIISYIKKLKNGELTDKEFKTQNHYFRNFFAWMHYVTVLEMFLDLIERIG